MSSGRGMPLTTGLILLQDKPRRTDALGAPWQFPGGALSHVALNTALQCGAGSDAFFQNSMKFFFSYFDPKNTFFLY